ncbi:hypothetical protein HYX19_04570 [Candidatus Woesearchaeota archaeon]|nr:hypothetical protein [Candidatus Woesearchaeota archaeon]
MGGVGGDIGKMSRNSLIKRSIMAGTMILGINFFGNGTYNYLYLNEKAQEIFGALNKRNGLYEKLQNASSNLALLNSLECSTEKCLETKLRLYEEIAGYSKEIEPKERQLRNLDERSTKARERAYVYGYFK